MEVKRKMKYNSFHLSEEKLIDFSLGKLHESDESEAQLHIDYCDECKERYEHWNAILTKETNEVEDFISVSKEKLWNKLEKQKTQKVQKRFVRSPRLIYGIGSAAALFLIIISAFILRGTYEKEMVISNEEIAQVENFQRMPDTRQLDIVPTATHQDINGNIWINDVTQEMLVEVGGLAQLTNRDYQLWIIYEDNFIKGVIIPIQNGSSRMFLKEMNVTEFKQIKASIEPKGGSKVPTGPATFIVEIEW